MSRVPDHPDRAELPCAADADILRLLDEEIARLPDHLRAAVVLCELDGVSRRDAAAQLGIAEGTLSSRLAKARKVLADRLRDRGVSLTVAGLAGLFGCTAGTVPTALADAAIKVATRTGLVPPAVAELSRGVFRTMLLKKLKVVAVGLVLAVGLSWLAVGSVLRSTLAQDAGKPVKKPGGVQGKAAKQAGPGRILFSRDGDFYTVDPDGKNERRIDLPPGSGDTVVPSPDGRSLAYWTQAVDVPGPTELCVRKLEGQAAVTRFKLPDRIGFILYCWSPDGTEIHINTGTPGRKGVQHLRVDLKARKLIPLKETFLKTHLVTDWTRDGKYFLTTSVGNGDEWQPRSLHLMNRDGTEHLALTGARDTALMGRLSPDGTRLLCMNSNRLSVMEVGKGKSPVPVAGIPEGTEVVGYTWSPDGKRIVFTTGTTRFLAPGELAKMTSRLIVADPDGKNAKVLRAARGDLMFRVYWH
jgi:dipeptidyl aminopeptidase/acylaminoacyl peptidase